jgi:hypothetical protein
LVKATKRLMLLLDRSMQESSRGASPEWIALRGPSPMRDSKRIDMGRVEKVFPFALVDASIGCVVREPSVEVESNGDHNFVVDSLILPVI